MNWVINKRVEALGFFCQSFWEKYLTLRSLKLTLRGFRGKVKTRSENYKFRENKLIIFRNCNGDFSLLVLHTLSNQLTNQSFCSSVHIT